MIARNRGIKHGSKFEQFAYEKIVPIGARVPQGGALGNGYSAYAYMNADSVDAIKVLMAHGRVSAFFLYP